MIEYFFIGSLKISLYYFFHVLGFLTVAVFNVWYGKKYEIKWHKALAFTALVYGLTYFWIHVQYWIESGFSDWGGQNIVRGFVYIPLIAWMISRFIKIEWQRMCDFIAPCVCIAQGVSHIGCIFPGCCYGYEWEWGLYNNTVGTRTFPIQLVEAATAWLIVLVVVFCASQKGYKVDGTSYPLMLILFGSTRFIWEFLRDNEKIFIGCSALAFHALFMVLVGGVIMKILLDKQKRKKRLEMNQNRKRRKK